DGGHFPQLLRKAAIGHAAAAPPRSVMNERRFTAPVLPSERIAHLGRRRTAALRDFNPRYDRFGSKCDEKHCTEHVCFPAIHGPARDCAALLSLTLAVL